MADNSENSPPPVLIELGEKQLKQLSDSTAAWRNLLSARRTAAEVRGSMRWRRSNGRDYLVRVSTTGAETSLGVRDSKTEALFADFHGRKAPAEARLKAMKETIDEHRKLNRLYGVGRAPAVVVRVLAALEDAGVAEQFLVVGTHAVYAYETAAGVRVDSGATATQDLDLLFDVRKLRAFNKSLSQRTDASLIKILQKADPTFRVRRDKLESAVNDSGFEVEILRRPLTEGDPHPLRMSDDEDDFWAVQASQGNALASARQFDHLVIASTGEMASMRTLHPLDFVRLKLQLSELPSRDPHKARKDRLQSQVAQQLWDEYLRHLEDARDKQTHSERPNPA